MDGQIHDEMWSSLNFLPPLYSLRPPHHSSVESSMESMAPHPKPAPHTSPKSTLHAKRSYLFSPLVETSPLEPPISAADGDMESMRSRIMATPAPRDIGLVNSTVGTILLDVCVTSA